MHDGWAKGSGLTVPGWQHEVAFLAGIVGATRHSVAGYPRVSVGEQGRRKVHAEVEATNHDHRDREEHPITYLRVQI